MVYFPKPDRYSAPDRSRFHLHRICSIAFFYNVMYRPCCFQDVGQRAARLCRQNEQFDEAAHENAW